jgi:hypothetical protein
MEKENDPSARKAAQRKSFREWKQRRDIAFKAIPLDVDLENREIFFQKDLKDKLTFEFQTNNVDRLISNYVDPRDSHKVKQGLIKAEKGAEEPITFNFIHPVTSQRMQFEYRYEIVYVRYASTRLQGLLVNIRDPKPGSRRQQ